MVLYGAAPDESDDDSLTPPEDCEEEPPRVTHEHPFSILQVDEQQSPSVVLPSSHCSGASCLPLPQTGPVEELLDEELLEEELLDEELLEEELLLEDELFEEELLEDEELLDDDDEDAAIVQFERHESPVVPFLFP